VTDTTDKRTNERTDGCPPLRYGAALSSLAMSGLAFSVAPRWHYLPRDYVKLHLRDGRTDGRRDALRLFVRPSVS